jgi:hypothetical protein
MVARPVRAAYTERKTMKDGIASPPATSANALLSSSAVRASSPASGMARKDVVFCDVSTRGDIDLFMHPNDVS